LCRRACHLIGERHRLAQPDHVPIVERLRASESLSINERAVGRTQVLQRKAARAAREAHVMAADLWIVNYNIVGNVPTNADNVFVQFVNLVGLWPPADDQPKAVVPLHSASSSSSG